MSNRQEFINSFKRNMIDDNAETATFVRSKFKNARKTLSWTPWGYIEVDVDRSKALRPPYNQRLSQKV